MSEVNPVTTSPATPRPLTPNASRRASLQGRWTRLGTFALVDLTASAILYYTDLFLDIAVVISLYKQSQTMEAHQASYFHVYFIASAFLLILPAILYSFMDPDNGRGTNAFFDPFTRRRWKYTLMNLTETRLMYESWREFKLSEGHLGNFLGSQFYPLKVILMMTKTIPQAYLQAYVVLRHGRGFRTSDGKLFRAFDDQLLVWASVSVACLYTAFFITEYLCCFSPLVNKSIENHRSENKERSGFLKRLSRSIKLVLDLRGIGKHEDLYDAKRDWDQNRIGHWDTTAKHCFRTALANYLNVQQRQINGEFIASPEGFVRISMVLSTASSMKANAALDKMKVIGHDVDEFGSSHFAFITTLKRVFKIENVNFAVEKIAIVLREEPVFGSRNKALLQNRKSFNDMEQLLHTKQDITAQKSGDLKREWTLATPLYMQFEEAIKIYAQIFLYLGCDAMLRCVVLMNTLASVGRYADLEYGAQATTQSYALLFAYIYCSNLGIVILFPNDASLFGKDTDGPRVQSRSVVSGFATAFILLFTEAPICVDEHLDLKLNNTASLSFHRACFLKATIEHIVLSLVALLILGTSTTDFRHSPTFLAFYISGVSVGIIVKAVMNRNPSKGHGFHGLLTENECELVEAAGKLEVVIKKENARDMLQQAVQTGLQQNRKVQSDSRARHSEVFMLLKQSGQPVSSPEQSPKPESEQKPQQQRRPLPPPPPQPKEMNEMNAAGANELPFKDGKMTMSDSTTLSAISDMKEHEFVQLQEQLKCDVARGAFKIMI